MGELITEPKIITNPLAARPAPGAVPIGWYFLAEDTGELFQSVQVSGTSTRAWILTLRAAPIAADVVSGGYSEFLLNGSAFVRSSIPRGMISTQALAPLTSGVMYSVAIPLIAGDVVTTIGFRSGTTAAVSPTAWWFALYDNAATPALLGQTANQGTAPWGASTAQELNLTDPVPITQDGVYYAAVMVAAATVPTLVGFSMATGGVSSAVTSGQRTLNQTSGSSLTATAPATITGAAANSNRAYAWVR